MRFLIVVAALLAATASWADDFTVSVTDASQLLGITAAREAYNASLPPAMNEKGEPIPSPDAIGSDAEYVQSRMMGAIRSWAAQYKTDLASIDAEIGALQAKRDEIAGKAVAIDIKPLPAVKPPIR
jgi:hypothetical protein